MVKGCRVLEEFLAQGLRFVFSRAWHVGDVEDYVITHIIP